MISELQAFLMEAAKEPKEKEVIISERLKDHPFKIRAISLGEYDEMRKRSVSHEGEEDKADGTELSRNLAIAGCVEPDFKSAEWLKEIGCATPAQALDKMLLAGEVMNISGEILKASGFDTDINKLKKKAKN